METSKKFSGSWLVANLASFWVGFIIGVLVLVALLYLDTPGIGYLNPGVMGLILGLVIGFGQHLFLRNRITHLNPFLWIISWAVGLSFGFLAAVYDDALLTKPFTFNLVVRVVIAGLLAGGLIGVLQWIGLRSLVRKGWTWILWNILAGSMVFSVLLIPILFLVSYSGGYSPQTINNEAGYLGATMAVCLCFFMSPLAGLFYGLITWIPMRGFLEEIADENSL